MPHDGALGSVRQSSGLSRTAPVQPATPRRADPQGGTFAESLAAAQTVPGLKFSAHATQRLAERNIRFTPEQLARVE